MMPRPSQQGHGYPPPHDFPHHVHPPQYDSHPHPHPRPGVPWGYPGPSFDSLVTVLGDEDMAHTARLVLDRAPDEMRVIVDLLVRLQLERWQANGHQDPEQARPPDNAATF
jgi:hypothetical protein